jgi:hypothetical protein
MEAIFGHDDMHYGAFARARQSLHHLATTQITAPDTAKNVT